jgi:FkbM family methyltransferase
MGKSFEFVDEISSSNSLDIIKNEILAGHYTFKDIHFLPGDILVDIGAHVGMISIMYAKLNPFIKILAFEPIPSSFKSLLKNIELNKIKNIIPINLAVTSDGRKVKMIINEQQTGGATQCLNSMEIDGHKNYYVSSTTLEKIFDDYSIKKIKLLKIDCEGSEYEILLNAKSVLPKIDFCIGELHINKHLLSKGYSFDLIYSLMNNNNINFQFTECAMADK